ncbi:CPBP family intramembrane glutamic endopeptidase [Pseudomonas coleopterorum]|uniref:CPBP family intramembrane glutamic endopeptidase n=1 Tax=Pseudomonas coleopterorum TaxID=1605838 RepID=A0AAJ6MS13_9PSED|nr:CPBP family intramembrane glutamic endopeptidase [Pseudomonas coleopterorum]WNC08517.1 CPBP family intramembrane glutamic endopeptidase [Pseudomonas coleopterorum]SEE09545.1 hypothetical protein SAMN05216510_1435 [Pseudomonas coleopterorum]
MSERLVWLSLLALGYGLASWHGSLHLPAVAAISLLLLAGLATRLPRLRIAAHALFMALALALGAHWLPGFDNARVLDAVFLDPEASAFTMHLNMDKPLIGFWLLLACPWTLKSGCGSLPKVAALVLITPVIVLGSGWALDAVAWVPKWPAVFWVWAANNLLLVCIVEELFFRGYLQQGLSHLLAHRDAAATVSLLVPTALFGLSHVGAGWQWALLASIAGLGYGLCYRAGGLLAAVLAHFSVNLLHFLLFSYPRLHTG